MRIGISFQELQVLLIEDDEMSRVTVRAMLAELGVQNIVVIPDCKEAINMFDQNMAKIDLVLCDWNMPEITGLDFLKFTRNKRKGLPFIMITGRNDYDSVISARDEGVNAYLRKPFTIEDLKEKIIKVMERSRFGEAH